MSIRKHGSDGEVIAAEQHGISKQAAGPWGPEDDQELAEENKADGAHQDDA